MIIPILIAALSLSQSAVRTPTVSARSTPVIQAVADASPKGLTCITEQSTGFILPLHTCHTAQEWSVLKRERQMDSRSYSYSGQTSRH